MLPKGSLPTGTVIVKVDPAQVPVVLVGVTVYTALTVPPVTLFSVSLIRPLPEPDPPVRPLYTAVQLNVLATPLLMSFCGLKLYAASLQTVLFVAFTPTGSGLTGTVIVNVLPTQVADVGVTVYNALSTPPVRLVSVSAMVTVPDPAPPVRPTGYTAVQLNVLANPFPLSTLSCGSKLNPASLQISASVLLTPIGSEETGTVIVKELPAQRSAVLVGVTV